MSLILLPSHSPELNRSNASGCSCGSDISATGCSTATTPSSMHSASHGTKSAPLEWRPSPATRISIKSGPQQADISQAGWHGSTSSGTQAIASCPATTLRAQTGRYWICSIWSYVFAQMCAGNAMKLLAARVFWFISSGTVDQSRKRRSASAVAESFCLARTTAYS